MTGRVLVGFDGSPSAWRALTWATERVVARGGSLDVLCVVNLALGSEAFGPGSELAAEAEAGLAQAEARVRETAPHVTASFQWIDGHAATELVTASAGASLVVVGTDKRPGEPGPAIGGIPVKVAAKARCPVAVIPDSDPAERSEVVVGVDRSESGVKSLAVAVTEASWLHAGVRAVHAWTVSAAFERGAQLSAEVAPEFVEAQRAVLDEAVAGLPAHDAVPIVTELVRARPAKALVDRGRGAALLVVGSRGRGRVAAAVLGSVSHDVLINIPCPMLVVTSAASAAAHAESDAESAATS